MHLYLRVSSTGKTQHNTIEFHHFFIERGREQLMKRKTLSENNLGVFEGNKYGQCASRVRGYEVRSKGSPGTQSFLAL